MTAVLFGVGVLLAVSSTHAAYFTQGIKPGGWSIPFCWLGAAAVSHYIWG